MQTLTLIGPGTQTLSVRFDLCNRIDFSLAIDGVAWSQDPQTVYSVAPGTSRSLALSFHPQRMGSKLCVLSLTHAAADVAPGVWPVQLYGVGQDPGRMREIVHSDRSDRVAGTATASLASAWCSSWGGKRTRG